MNQARKRTGTKKVLSMILVLVMLLSLLSMAAFTLPTAASSDSAASNDDSFYRIVHLDCGRKYFSKDWIIALLNEMKADGYNQLQLAFGNDGLRFLLDDMSFTANGIKYLHSDVVSKVEAGNKLQNSSGDASWLTQTEMDEIIATAQTLGIIGLVASFICSCLPIVGLVLGILAVVNGKRAATEEGQDKDAGTAGRICGIIAIIVSAIVLALIIVSYVLVLSGFTDAFWEEYYRQMEFASGMAR